MSVLDPVTMGIVWHKLLTICREMDRVVERTSASFITAQLHDVSFGIFDRQGRAVALHVGLPSQIIGGTLQIKVVLEKFKDNLREGDVILMNDPYLARGAHLPDWTFFRPIFYGGELVFFAFARGHQLDTGGAYPTGYFANTYDIHAEGIRIHPVKIFEAGVEQEVYRLILNNVRWSDQVRLDNMALMAATKKCEERCLEIIDRYGRDETLAILDGIIASMERAMQNEIGKMREGTFYGEASADDDGARRGVPVTVRCEVTFAGGRMTLDFSKSDRQVEYINSPLANTIGTALGQIFSAVDPDLSFYHNEGSLIPIQFICPEGTVVNPVYPATVGACPIIVGNQIVESVNAALAQATPESVVAPWARTYHNYLPAKDVTGRSYTMQLINAEGGGGAIWGYDGWPNCSPPGSGGMLVKPSIEMLEALFPWRTIRYELIPDSMGAGHYRGGPGTRWELVNLGGDGLLLTGSCDGETTQSPGVAGGKTGKMNRQMITREGQEIIIRAKSINPIRAGDRILMESGGGAGVGDPILRPPEKVREDLMEGLVSPEAVQREYGLVIDPDTFEIDRAATDAAGAARSSR